MRTETSTRSIGNLLLNNDHNVYILGAGFSVDGGMPVVKNFLQKMRDALDWLEQQTDRQDEIHAVGEVLRFLHKAAAAGYRSILDAENIEEVFSLASASDDEQITNSMVLAIAATLDYCESQRLPLQICINLLESRTGRPPLPKSMDQLDVGPGFSRHSAPIYQYYASAMLGLLGDAKPRANNTFVSFNYDLLLEEALIAAGVGFDYGSALIPCGQSEASHGSAPVSVLKLHGSVNWASSEHGKQIEVHSDYTSLRTVGKVPVLLPPTWRKDFSKHFADIWAKAVAAIRNATRICVIGFSMPETDVHFRYLLSAGLQDNISLRRIVFIDPSPEVIRDRITKVLRPEMFDRGILEILDAKVEYALCDAHFLRRLGRAPTKLPEQPLYRRLAKA